MDFNKIIAKAKEFAGKNPDKVRQGIDKAEAVVNQKTGGKYSDQIKKGADAVEGQLGIDPQVQPSGQQQVPSQTDGQAPQQG
jgi:hypothetical protein